jgi:hypothetical protein
MSSAHNSYYISPNRASNSSQLGATSHPAEYAGGVASPAFAAPSTLPSLNQVHDPARHGQEARPGPDFPPQESRRSSVGSQVNLGMNGLQINGAGSPYPDSANHSSASLAQNLSRERGLAAGPALRTARSTAQLPLSPLSPAEGEARFGPRIAPPIGRNPRSDVYNANEPAPGQAYAFPDPPDVHPGDLPPKQVSQTRLNSSHGSRPGSFGRRDSGQHSVASSAVTGDLRLPPGQRRLDEGEPPAATAASPSSSLTPSAGAEMPDLPEMPGTHHHTLQQSQMSNYDEDEAMTPEDGVTPYSRTPALRVSHKMAERKRRSEMKDLFENLRSQIPSNQGSKSSKWEILTKGGSPPSAPPAPDRPLTRPASDYIKTLEGSAQSGHAADKQLRLACHDLDRTRRENDSLRNENQRLMQELQLARQAQQAHAQPPPMYPAHAPYGVPPPPSLHDPINRSLPPLANGTASAPTSMQGIQYSHEHR